METSPPPSQHPNHSDRMAAGRYLLDYFLNPSLLEDADVLRRARILVTGICAIIPISCFATLIITFAPIPATARLLGLPPTLFLLAALAILLFKMKRDGDYALCCNVATGLILICIAYGVFITGGVTSSPMAQLLAGPPLIAFFMGGLRVGWNMLLATTLILAGALLVEHNGIRFPQALEQNQIGISHALVVMVGLFANAMLALVYERTSTVLRNERDKEHKKVMQLAHTDPLTGLANRRIFDQRLAERIAQYWNDKHKQPFALCYLDLNGFKPINDRHGHDVGDEVLRAIAIRLRSSLRGTDLISRPGGDEFTLLLGQLNLDPELEAWATRFLHIIAEPIETSAGLLSVGGSIGFAFFPQHGTDAESLAKAADSAMYEAKRNKLGWRVFGAEQQGRNDARQ